MLAGRHLACSPLAKASPARARTPLSSSPGSRPRATAVPCRHGESAGRCRRVAAMQRHGHALVGHQEPPDAPASPSSLICDARPSLSPSLSHAVAAGRDAVCYRRRSSELLLLVVPTFSSESEATSNFASPTRTSRTRLVPLGKTCSAAGAHRSEPELQRTLGSHGSLSLLRHWPRF